MKDSEQSVVQFPTRGDVQPILEDNDIWLKNRISQLLGDAIPERVDLENSFLYRVGVTFGIFAVYVPMFRLWFDCPSRFACAAMMTVLSSASLIFLNIDRILSRSRKKVRE